MAEHFIHPGQGEMLAEDNEIKPELTVLHEVTDTPAAQRQKESNEEYYGHYKRPWFNQSGHKTDDQPTAKSSELLFTVGDQEYSTDEIYSKVAEFIDDYVSEVEKTIKYADYKSPREFQLMLCIKVLLKSKFRDELLANPKYLEFKEAEAKISEYEEENR